MSKTSTASSTGQLRRAPRPCARSRTSSMGTGRGSSRTPSGTAGVLPPISRTYRLKKWRSVWLRDGRLRRNARTLPASWSSSHRAWAWSYQGETWMLDALDGVCAGQARFEYPATFVLFSMAVDHQKSRWCRGALMITSLPTVGGDLQERRVAQRYGRIN